MQTVRAGWQTWAADVVASETLNAPAEEADPAADSACRSIIH